MRSWMLGLLLVALVSHSAFADEKKSLPVTVTFGIGGFSSAVGGAGEVGPLVAVQRTLWQSGVKYRMQLDLGIGGNAVVAQEASMFAANAFARARLFIIKDRFSFEVSEGLALGGQVSLEASTPLVGLFASGAYVFHRKANPQERFLLKMIVQPAVAKQLSSTENDCPICAGIMMGVGFGYEKPW